jgi:hypothetical protein
MFVVLDCVRCRHLLRVRGCYRGKTVRCPNCAAVLTVPEAGAEKLTAVDAEYTERKKEKKSGSRRVRPVKPLLLLLPFVFSVCSVSSVVISSTLRGEADTQAAATPIASKAGGDATHAPDTKKTSPSQEVRLNVVVRPPLPVDLVSVAHLGDLLSVAVAPDADGGSAFVTTVDGSLKRFSYPDFQPRAVYQLEQPAYRAALDARRGLLWVAACEPHALRINNLGDRPSGRGDLHAYDIRELRSGRKPAGARLHPRHVLPVDGDILEILASADRRWLFYLARSADGVHLGRIDAERCAADARLSLPAETRALCRTADGATLYAAGGKTVCAIDPEPFRLRRRVEVDAGDIHAIAADNDGRVFLAEQGQWTNLTRLDLSAAPPSLQRWSARLHGRLYLGMAADQHRLYVGTSSVISSQLHSLLIHRRLWKIPPQVGLAMSDAKGVVRGEFFLTPDGNFLVNRWGRVFRLAQGPMQPPQINTVVVHR